MITNGKLFGNQNKPIEAKTLLVLDCTFSFHSLLHREVKSLQVKLEGFLFGGAVGIFCLLLYWR